jgi:Carbamoyl-phosphate synthase L chain, ATP binding domain
VSHHLVVLTFGSTRQSRELHAAAKRLGYRLETAHVREDVRDWLARDVSDVLAAARSALARLSRRPDALVNFGRATVPEGIGRVAEVMERLRVDGEVPPGTALVGPTAWAAHVWGDKARTAAELRRLGLPIPQSSDVSAESLESLILTVKDGSFPLPLVVKATDLTGGAGMRFVADVDRLAGAVSELAGSGHRLIATQFVSGDEVSVDLLRLGDQTLVYPPGFKRATDTLLTHADHKVKVNGVVRSVPEFERDVRRIAAAFDLQGFFSLEAVVVGTEPMSWRILEGATRVTNNIQLQDASLGFDSYEAVLRYLARQPWLPDHETLRLALSVPIYVHRGEESVEALAGLDWVRQVKLENLAEMPDSRDSRVRLTVKMAVTELDAQLRTIAAATGDGTVADRVRTEVERIGVRYGA